ncbi:hypothetical protein CLF_108762 [Clonorchis sinensis]|uniref:Uncharacterized protein n=1 Tax=Clonorchis sinensis TaxID=79923 RepID=G7YRX7_CLOSI|nr:hypothetical protein CLF_108762 [Clonorchis sinensis]
MSGGVDRGSRKTCIFMEVVVAQKAGNTQGLLRLIHATGPRNYSLGAATDNGPNPHVIVQTIGPIAGPSPRRSLIGRTEDNLVGMFKNRSDAAPIKYLEVPASYTEKVHRIIRRREASNQTKPRPANSSKLGRSRLEFLREPCWRVFRIHLGVFVPIRTGGNAFVHDDVLPDSYSKALGSRGSVCVTVIGDGFVPDGLKDIEIDRMVREIKGTSPRLAHGKTHGDAVWTASLSSKAECEGISNLKVQCLFVHTVYDVRGTRRGYGTGMRFHANACGTYYGVAHEEIADADSKLQPPIMLGEPMLAIFPSFLAAPSISAIMKILRWNSGNVLRQALLYTSRSTNSQGFMPGIHPSTDDTMHLLRVTGGDFQVLYGGCVRPILEHANQVVFWGRKKDITLIERVQRAAARKFPGLGFPWIMKRVSLFGLFPLEGRCLRGDPMHTYSLFDRGLDNGFLTVDSANTLR